MRSFLFYTVLVENYYPVSVLYRCKTMRDSKRCTAFCKRLQASGNQQLALIIERRSCLVQYQDLRVLKEHSGNGNALLLASGQLDSPLSYVSVNTGRKHFYKLHGTGELCGAQYFIICSSGFSVSYIFSYGTAEQVHVLLDYPYGLPQRLKCYMADILTVYHYLS